ncbi:MAG TPA: hypothetical protein VG755_15305 [Nannocystaceae bacterium]|nr:hypothetical protein [Nannocystaceae bacterium]
MKWVVALFVLAFGCAQGVDERHVTVGVTSVGSSTLTTGATDDASSSGSSSGDTSESTSEPADSTGDIGPSYVARGIVIDFGTLNMPPAAGATVTLSGNPAISTQTAADGSFELPVPQGQISFVEVAREGYWGALVRADAGTGDVELGEINIANDTFIEVKVGAFPNFDFDKAAVIGRSTATDTALTLLENGTAVSAPDEYFSIDADINFTLGDNVTRSAGFPAVVFFNVDDRPAGALTMSASHPSLPCAVAGPAPPIQPRTISWVEITCQ